MNTISESKTPAQNCLEGFVLTALFQGLPIYTVGVLVMKVMGSHAIVDAGGGPVFFALAGSVSYGILAPWLGSKFPEYVRYEPLFFDSSLSFSGKMARWSVQPRASMWMATALMMMSVFAIGAASLG